MAVAIAAATVPKAALRARAVSLRDFYPAELRLAVPLLGSALYMDGQLVGRVTSMTATVIEIDSSFPTPPAGLVSGGSVVVTMRLRAEE